MEAIKKSNIKRRGNEIILTLPDTFTADEVDVLIWPSNESPEIQQNDLSADLLKWPIMTDEEFSFINEKRKHLNAWL